MSIPSILLNSIHVLQSAWTAVILAVKPFISSFRQKLEFLMLAPGRKEIHGDLISSLINSVNPKYVPISLISGVVKAGCKGCPSVSTQTVIIFKNSSCFHQYVMFGMEFVKDIFSRSFSAGQIHVVIPWKGSINFSLPLQLAEYWQSIRIQLEPEKLAKASASRNFLTLIQALRKAKKEEILQILRNESDSILWVAHISASHSCTCMCSSSYENKTLCEEHVLHLQNDAVSDDKSLAYRSIWMLCRLP